MFILSCREIFIGIKYIFRNPQTNRLSGLIHPPLKLSKILEKLQCPFRGDSSGSIYSLLHRWPPRAAKYRFDLGDDVQSSSLLIKPAWWPLELSGHELKSIHS